MPKIEIPIGNDNCPEIAAKQKYESYLKQILRGEENEKIIEETELLEKFLTSGKPNFKEIRSKIFKLFNKGKEVKVVIYSENKEAKYRIEAR